MMRSEYGGVLTKIFRLLQAIEKNTADIAKELKKVNRDKPVVNVSNTADAEFVRDAIDRRN